ncbi:SusC/RagA family TonB-linked outer membrane protein [Flavobacterium sp. GP15]|uniref:SusC/RagA family TonB-linked outer membrane protein n=1 Tax=Flavobacterium sp. GP15 TaxID=2758567 RepID=UPI00165E7A6D|nr:SusC/RagA family TonB-linked outer membrane protein [Flavobacterium sp. GP15]
MKNISLIEGKAVLWFVLICILLCTNLILAKKSVIPAAKIKADLSLRKENLHQVQIKKITGTVTDNQGQLPGVTVFIKGKSVTVITDFDGKYVIDASSTDTLVFSFMGYKTIEVPVNGNTTINMRLQEDATALQEVKVNAGYYSVKESERTGSIARITSKDIERQPVTNVLASMQGRMAGVDIIQDGGTAGGGFQIKIRGRNSIRADGNEPLFVIDGVPYSSESIGSPGTSTAMASQMSPLNSINPADIESIEVLKDADATAIYGSRGANGVVLISTKKGKAGKTKFSISATTGVGTATRFVALMNTDQYLAMRRQGYANDGVPFGATAYDVNGTWDQSRSTNWQKELLGGSALIQNIQASVSGGSSTTNYLLSGNYRTEGTVLPADFRYNKGAVHYTMNHVSDNSKFRIQFGANYTTQDNLQAATDLTLTAKYLAPNAPALYDADGRINWENNTFDNPIATLQGIFCSKTNDLVSNLQLSYQLGGGFEVKTNFGFTDLQQSENRILPSTIYNPAYAVGSDNSVLYMNNTKRKSGIIEPQLRWQRDFGKSSLDVLIGGTKQQQTTERLFQSGIGFTNNSLITNFASATTKNILNSDTFLYRYYAYFGRLNYIYDEKYIVNVTGRKDGSSRFGPGRQFATFGAVGAAWIFSKESFVSENSFLSYGKFRMSYGITGNDQIGDYQFYDTYAATGANYQGITGLQPTRLYNADFGWETNRKLEGAIETGFFKDQIFLTASYYRNRSSDQLVGIPMPATTGFSSLTSNLDATVQNNGFEFTLRTVNFSKGNFNWSTNFTYSASRNTLLSFPGLAGSTSATRYVIGQPLDIAKLYHLTGVNSNSGVYEFEDVTGDGLISIADKQTLVDLSPKFFGGLQNQFQYKNWQLDFLIQFVKKQAYDYISNVPGGTPYNQSTNLTDAWQKAGDQSLHQLNTAGLNSMATVAYNRYAESDAVVTDGSYVRLKNVYLSYDLPLKMLKEVNCKLFVQGQNILTFTPYRGGDPEFRFSGFLPPLRVISGGMTLTF